MIKDFKYLRPGSVKEALGLLAEHKDDCKIICGGQSLLILLRQGLVATEHLIDIKRLEELNYIKFDAGEGLRIGATTTHRTIEKSDLIREKYEVTFRHGESSGPYPGSQLGDHRWEPGPRGPCRRPCAGADGIVRQH